MRLDRGNHREIIESLQNENNQSRVSSVQKIRISLQLEMEQVEEEEEEDNCWVSLQEEEEDNSWVLDILQDLVTAVQDDDSHLKSLDFTGRGVSSAKWPSLSPELLAQVLISLDKGSFKLTRSGLFNPSFKLTRTGLTSLSISVYQFQSNWYNIDNLSPDHISSLFKMIAESSVTNMKELSLYDSMMYDG